MNIETKPITPALTSDYFDFFDNRAFTDHAEWSCCYCTWFHMDKAHEQRIGEMVKADRGGENALRRALKGAAAEFIKTGTLHGYLAYKNGVPIGWVNANDKAVFLRFDADLNINGFLSSGDKAKAVTCFVIAPEYRGKGVATALLERVCEDAKSEGYAAVEGYPRLRDNREPFDYNGPVQLYEKCGFVRVAQQGSVTIMRKEIGEREI